MVACSQEREKDVLNKNQTENLITRIIYMDAEETNADITHCTFNLAINPKSQ